MFSKIVRRTHMYLALFLTPWVLMYALSTVVMNHRDYFISKYGRGPVPFEKERELTYDATFSGNAEPNTIARQILASLSLDGAYNVNQRKDGVLVINRASLTEPRRITFTPSDHKLVIEKLQPRANAFLERFHRRRGYQQDYKVDDTWAFSVDLFIAAMIFWVLSGLWMWWEMKLTRALGAIAIAGGIGVFVFYLLTL